MPAPTSSATPKPSVSEPVTGPTESAPGASAAPSDPDSSQPVPKVTRPGANAAPKHESEPASTTEPVVYSDGVSVQIVDVTFGEETSQGPGSFPGRAYARLTLELSNASPTPIDLGTSVLTVLDGAAQPVPRVYAHEADVRDFSGSLAPGATATAVYAFAVSGPGSPITLVVDFDALHTSAVFRGSLS